MDFTKSHPLPLTLTLPCVCSNSNSAVRVPERKRRGRPGTPSFCRSQVPCKLHTETLPAYLPSQPY